MMNYEEARKAAAYGIQSGLLHIPPDAGEQDDALAALDDTISEVARLSGGHRGRKKADQCFDEEREAVITDDETPANTHDGDEEPQEAAEDGEEGE